MITGAKLARTEMTTLVKTLRSMKTDADVFNDGVTVLNKAFDNGTISIKTHQAALARLEQNYMQTTAAATKATQVERDYAAALERTTKMESSAATVKSQRWNNQGPSGGGGLQAAGMAVGGNAGMLLGMGAKLAVPVGIALAAKETLSLASAAEQAQAKFEVLSGSVSTASALVVAMKRLDAESPLNFGAIQKAASTMMQYGIANTQVMPIIRQMGEITGGNSERFERMGLAMGQVSAAGKLTGQELLQMINAGFNPLQEISRTTGKSMSDLKDMMRDGAVSADMVKDSFASATAEGGRFHGMMDRINKTGEGQFNKMISDLQRIGLEIGEGLMPVAVELLGIFRDVLPVLTPVVALIKLSGTGIGLVASFVHDLVGDTMTVLTAIFTGDYSKPIGQFENFNGMLDKALASQKETAGVITNQETGMAGLLNETNQAAEATAKLEEANKAALDAQNKANDAYSEELKAMHKIIDARQMTEEAIKRRERLEKGMSQEQIADLERTQQRVDMVNAITKAEKERADAVKNTEKTMADLQEQGKALTEKSDPAAKVVKELADLQVLLRVNAIDTATFAREQQRVLSEAAKDGLDEIKSPASIEAGSQEAYRFMVDSQNDKLNDQLKTQREQVILAQASLAAQQEANRKLAEIAEGKVRTKR
jgi:tape measure domain-containing protein